MKKRLTSMMVVLFAAALTLMAKPAKPGMWKTLTLTDGTTVRAFLTGDEHGHFWVDADGRAYLPDNQTERYRIADISQLTQRALQRRQHSNQRRAERSQRRRVGTMGHYTGQKRGLVILVNYSDKKLKTTHDVERFERITNETGYSEGQFVGSTADYFKAQSGKQFELTFDIVGPVTLSKSYSYYGQNDEEGSDMHVAEMAAEAVTLAKDLVADWSVYDWDQDGEVDQVYIIYAGYGEADYDGDSNVVWPHEFSLSAGRYYGDGPGAVTVTSGLKVDTYACSSELNGSGAIDGIGSMCHEFSHCLGLPDFYDTAYKGGQGMGYWDLMDSGTYNGNGYCPAGYTSYERWEAGWLEPIVLEDNDQDITQMASLQSGGPAYVIYNKGHRDECYLLENRQLDGWDQGLPGRGLLILHLDYNTMPWYQNTVNANPEHQRMTWVAADGSYDKISYQGQTYYTFQGMAKDTYPSGSNNAFNSSTTPAATLYHKNSNGTMMLDTSVENIRQESDHTVSFRFVAHYDDESSEEPVVPLPEGAVFYESFDQCEGTGGNDFFWNGSIANSELITDNPGGWVTDKGYGAYRCARFGSSSVAGKAVTKPIVLTGDATLTFRAGAWNGSNDSEVLHVTAVGGTTDPATVTMQKGAFSDYTVTVTANQAVLLSFTSERGRFFLDEVVLSPTTTAIRTIPAAQPRQQAVYTLDGRYAGHSLQALPHGLYIVGGRKVVR